MAKSPAFQFYPVDFSHGVADFTTEEVGAYILLLCRQWDKGAIPDDQAACAKIARCQPSTVASVWHKFGICDEFGRKNARLEAVRAEQASYREKQAANGKKRWSKSGGNASAEPTLSGGNASAEPTLSGGNAMGMPKACPSPSPLSSIVPLSSPEGDKEPVSSETEAAEKKEEGAGAKRARIAADAGARILALFSGATQLSQVSIGQLYEHVDNGTLPADEKKWRALAAMRAERATIPEIPEDYDLRAAWLISKERLCRDLAEALDTALAKRPQGSPSASTEKKDAPPGWQAAAAIVGFEATDWTTLPAAAKAAIRRQLAETAA